MEQIAIDLVGSARAASNVTAHLSNHNGVHLNQAVLPVQPNAVNTRPYPVFPAATNQPKRWAEERAGHPRRAYGDVTRRGISINHRIRIRAVAAA
jgi:hypothetical protein